MKKIFLVISVLILSLNNLCGMQDGSSGDLELSASLGADGNFQDYIKKFDSYVKKMKKVDKFKNYVEKKEKGIKTLHVKFESLENSTDKESDEYKKDLSNFYFRFSGFLNDFIGFLMIKALEENCLPIYFQMIDSSINCDRVTYLDVEDELFRLKILLEALGIMNNSSVV